MKIYLKAFLHSQCLLISALEYGFSQIIAGEALFTIMHILKGGDVLVWAGTTNAF